MKLNICIRISEVLYLYYVFLMDYKKKSLKNLNRSESYEEIDTRLASGWYVDSADSNKKKNTN